MVATVTVCEVCDGPAPRDAKRRRRATCSPECHRALLSIRLSALKGVNDGLTAVQRYRLRHPERERENQRRQRSTDEFRAKNREHARRWRQNNPGRLRMGDREWRNVLLRDPCSYCGAPSQEIDHIVARSRGGDDSPENATPACLSCNRRKFDRPLLVWLSTRRARKG